MTTTRRPRLLAGRVPRRACPGVRSLRGTTREALADDLEPELGGIRFAGVGRGDEVTLESRRLEAYKQRGTLADDFEGVRDVPGQSGECAL